MRRVGGMMNGTQVSQGIENQLMGFQKHPRYEKCVQIPPYVSC